MRKIWIAAALALSMLCSAVFAQTGAPGWLGVTVETVTPAMKREKGLAAFGVFVGAIDIDSPATGALEAGDVITIMNDDEVRSAAAFDAAVAAARPGDKLALSVARGRQIVAVDVAVAAKPVPVARAAAFAGVGEPLLRIDGGGHQGVIRSIAFTPDGRRLVSAGDDKVIRVWDLETGQTARTIRGESAPGPAGKIFAMALSRDGKWLAVGGWMKIPGEEGHHIRLYDVASGELKALLKGHTNVVNGLAFSPNGARLISGSGDFTAMIWDIATRVEGGARPPKDVPLKGHTDVIYAVGFTPDGARAVTGSDDTTLRLWRAGDGAPIGEPMTGHGDKVGSLAVAPDGTIASGDVAGEIRLWDGRTGKALRTLRTPSTGVGIGSLSFSADSRLLLAASGSVAGKDTGTAYDTATWTAISNYTVHDNVVIATAFSPNGRWAATGGGNNNEIHLWDPATGTRRLSLDPEADGKPLRLGGQGKPVYAVGFTDDGRRIGWGNIDGCPTKPSCPNEHIILEQALTLPSGDGALGAPAPLASTDAGAFRRAGTRFGAWSLAHRKGGAYGYDDTILDIREGERVVATIERGPTDGYGHRAYTFSPDGETIVSGGSNGRLAAYDRAGQKLGDFIGHEGDVLAVAASPDGRFLVSGSDDQTVRLWNLKSRELIVTLFRGTDGEWVLYTPQGYYKASAGGAKFLTWQVNKGPEHAACAVTGEQLYKPMNRPALVAKAIQLASAKAAIAAESDVKDFKLSSILTDCAPALRPLPPEDGGLDEGRARGTGRVTLTLALEPSTLPVTAFEIEVNKKSVTQGRRPVDWKPARPKRPVSKEGFELRAFDIPLQSGQNEITVTATNQAGKSEAVTYYVYHEGEGDLDGFGTLHILAIGVDKYPGIRGLYNDLRFAGADARAFADAAAAEMKSQYAAVKTTLLVNRKPGDPATILEPTAANIEAALEALDGIGAKDTVMLFIAGHGEGKDRAYTFLPTDATRKPDDKPGTGSNLIRWERIQSALTKVGGRRLIFVDTCHPGGAYNLLLTSDADRENFVAFTATQDEKPAREDESLGHGLFTKAVVDGIRGGAADTTRMVRVLRFSEFVIDRVMAMSEGVQTPKYRIGTDNFILVKP